MSKFTAPSRISPAASVSATGAVTLLALFAASESQGAIITNADLDLSGFTQNLRDEESVNWNIDNVGDAEVQFVFSSYGGLDLKNPANSFEFVGAAGESLRNLALLPLPETISSDALFFGPSPTILILGGGSQGSPVFDKALDFISGTQGYIGFRFKPDDTMLYGWAAVTFTTDLNGPFTLGDWAYDDSGASIQVGQTAASAIPEPASVAAGLGALALGAAGLRRWRKQKAA